MTDEVFAISDIARLLNVSTATLRFWEEKRLFSVGKGKNRYRRYTVHNLAEIADVIFFRNLGIPVSQVGTMGAWTLEEYACQLQNTQSQLEEKIRAYSQMYHRTQNQLRHLEEVQRLMKRGYCLEEVPFRAVFPFDYQEKEKLRLYTQDPSRYVRYSDSRDMNREIRGIILPPELDGGTPLWQKPPKARFVSFLIREKVEHNYKSDVTQTLAQIQEHYDTGHLLSQYLCSATEHNERTDYLKAYLEIK